MTSQVQKTWRCLICRKPVPEYEPDFCCGGHDCSCQGEPMTPCVCSGACYTALIVGIGKPYEERRKDAQIPLRDLP